MRALFLLVVFASISVFFSKEISEFIKKIYNKPWVRFVVSLLVATWIWVWFDEFMPLFLTWLQSQLLAFILHPASVFPAGIRWMAFVLSLFLFASLPTWVSLWLANKNEMKLKEHFVAMVYLFSWLFFAILML